MHSYVKRFSEWFKLKRILDCRFRVPPKFNEGEIWWCSVGENVGIEISGKGIYFRRPVMILRKLDSYSFIGLPISRTVRSGSWYEHVYINELVNTVILSQVRYFDYRRLDKKYLALSVSEICRIKTSFIRLIINRNKSPAL